MCHVRFCACGSFKIHLLSFEGLISGFARSFLQGCRELSQCSSLHQDAGRPKNRTGTTNRFFVGSASSSEPLLLQPEPLLREQKAEPESPEPFSRNRNRNRPCLSDCAETQTPPLPRGTVGTENPEALEQFHTQTVTEPNRTAAALQMAF